MTVILSVVGSACRTATVGVGTARTFAVCLIPSSIHQSRSLKMSAGGSKVMIPLATKGQSATDCPGVLAGDTSKTKMGLVVLQEWWGLNEQIQEAAQDLSARGPFVTIVPDLYRGKVATDNEEAGHLMGNLDWPGAIRDIQACAQYLKTLGCTKVGVTGFCMGGALSLAAAVAAPEIDAAAPFYGIPSAESFDVSKIKIPLQCHFAEKDEVAGFSDLPAQKAFQERLEAGKVKHDFFLYPGVGHAFTNSKGQNFNKEACDLSFSRMVEFFRKNLA